MERTIEMYNGKVYGVQVSDYGLEKGYLDYQTVAAILEDCIYNGTIREATYGDWEIVNGEYEDVGEVMSDYIISDYGYKFLAAFTDELVFYNENLDVYVWAVTHYGTAWSHVLTDIKLV